jgi:hypothetical protein
MPLEVASQYKEHCIDILPNHLEAISINKYNLGMAKGFTHKINWKNNDLIYRKKYTIPEASHQFFEQTLQE